MPEDKKHRLSDAGLKDSASTHKPRQHAYDALERKNRELSDSLSAMQAALDKANAANHAKSEFLTHMSHEIRTPMNAILGLADILEMSSPLTPRQKEFIKTLKLSANSLLALINDLSDTSRIESQSIALGETAEAEKAPEKGQSQQARTPKDCPRVLLVEDYPANILVATSYLDDFGYIYEVVNDGLAAVEKARAGKFDAILMDVQMQGIDGFEATGLIRENEKQAGTLPVFIIGMTAHAFAGDRERCLNAGMDDYLSKPFNPDVLKSKLLAAVENAAKIA